MLKLIHDVEGLKGTIGDMQNELAAQDFDALRSQMDAMNGKLTSVEMAAAAAAVCSQRSGWSTRTLGKPPEVTVDATRYLPHHCKIY